MCEKSAEKAVGEGETRKVKNPLSPFSSLPSACPLEAYKQVTSCAPSPKRQVWMVALKSLDRVNLYCWLAVNWFLFPVFRQTCAGLEQYAMDKFAESLEVIPRTLAENAGVKPTELISKLKAAHQGGDKNAGFDNEV